jgi:hypothetical protein
MGATATASCGGSTAPSGGGDAATPDSSDDANDAYHGPVPMYGPGPVDAGKR